MDADRQIRLAIPPFFLLSSLIWGAHVKGITPWFPTNTQDALLVLGAGAVVVLPIGYVISTVGITIVRLLFLAFNQPTYEAHFSDQDYKTVWQRIRKVGPPDKSKTLFVGAVFDHGYLSPGINAWLRRRWTSFNLALHSSVALGFALLLAPVVGFLPSKEWMWQTALLVLIFSLSGIRAWCEVMEMLAFEAARRNELVYDYRGPA